MTFLNQQWSNLIIETLVSQNITYFCIAPGSRNTPLTLAAEEHPLTKTHIHFDERGLGFHALGYGKATKTPAVIIVTSGTAVGNLLPCIMEAHHSNTPLLVFTADRPFELRDCGANQTTTQTSIFNPWVLWDMEFSVPKENINPSVIESKIAYAVFQAKTGGVVHINFLFQEPLYQEEVSSFFVKRSLSYYPSEKHLSAKSANLLQEKLNKAEKGLILIGKDLSCDEAKLIHSFSKDQNWPIISELFAKPFIQNPIAYYDWFSKPEPDCILHFGSGFISKKLLNWLETISPKSYCQIHPSEKHVDPSHRVSDRVISTYASFCQSIHLPKIDSSWIDLWKKEDAFIKENLKAFFTRETDLTEPLFFHRFNTFFPQCKNLFIANSMPIRDANLFLDFDGLIFANRGLSGIDGNISTAIGIAQGLKQPLVAILGDLTFLADLNSLAQLQNCTIPIQIVVFNNSGGSIFSHLPIHTSAHFEKCFQAKHSLQFHETAKQFGLSYKRIETIEELNHDFSKTSLIELTTCAKKNSSVYQHLRELHYAVLS